jgi:hypothetical protein
LYFIVNGSFSFICCTKYVISEFSLKFNKSIDLLNLSENSDIPYLVQQINEKEPLTIKYKSKIQKVIESNYI